MRQLSSEQLLANASAKGIKFRKGDKPLFKKHDYFQVINGYKWLFVKGVEDINKIINNVKSNSEEDILRYQKSFQIQNYSSKEDLCDKICIRICNKYGLKIEKNCTLNQKIDAINKIDYVHHIYNDETYYGDFVRAYDFEHELRNTLLKYVLIIEENIKRVFISTLNDHQVNANYLADINSYNAESNNNSPLQSLEKVIQLHESNHSKPIMRKRKQAIVVPYWILINEMTLGQTIKSVKNLNEEMYLTIMQNFINEFTNINEQFILNYSKQDIIKRQKQNIYFFGDILGYIGDFRNLLAHNQPIYCFNIKDCSLKNFPKFDYEKPCKPKDIKDQSLRRFQNDKNKRLMNRMSNFFGQDDYNQSTHQVNIDLSWIIYTVSRIINKINPDNTFKTEIVNIYRKYHIFNFSYNYHLNAIEPVIDLVNLYENNKNIISNEDLIKIIENIDNKGKYKRSLHSLENKYISYISEIHKYIRQIRVKRGESKYAIFPRTERYSDYTNINTFFLQNL